MKVNTLNTRLFFNHTLKHPFISSSPVLPQRKTNQPPKGSISDSKSYLTDKQTVAHRQTKGSPVRNQWFTVTKQKVCRHIKVHNPPCFMQNALVCLHIIAFTYALSLLTEPFPHTLIPQ